MIAPLLRLPFPISNNDSPLTISCRQCNNLSDFRMASEFMKNPQPASSTSTSETISGFGSRKSAGALLAGTASANAPGAKVAEDTKSTTETKPENSKLRANCPPDSEALGRATWTFLHTMAANYPEKPDFSEQVDMLSFFNTFSKIYPCWYCADDFRKWMNVRQNKPRVSSQEELNIWLCEAHNNVNRKLGKKEFNCQDWMYRWKKGWPDGRCD